MPDVVAFLERLGQDGRLRYASSAQLEGELASAGIDGGTRAALLAGDATRLEALLGARANVCCLIVVPDGEADPSAEDSAAPLQR